jgi:RNA polymerase sigma factor (sigma-70 family)
MNAESVHHADSATRLSLLKRVRDPRDAESWQHFFQKYWKLIYQLALRHGLTDFEAEEVVQLTMISVSENLPKFRYNPAKGSFRSWLLTQARWHIHEVGRTKRERENVFQPLDERQVAPPRPNHDTATALLHGIIDSGAYTVVDGDWSETVHAAAMAAVRAQVSAIHYQVFDLYVLRKWSAKRVAATLGVRRFLLYLWSTRMKRVYEQELRRILATDDAIAS